MTNINNSTRTSNYRVLLPILGSEIQYAQGVQLPGLNINPVPGYNGGLPLKLEGDTYTIDPVTISLIVDENYSLMKKIYNIFKNVVHSNSGAINPNYNFESIIEVTNNDGIPVFAMELCQCALQSIAPITLISNSQDDIIVVDLTIEPSYYNLIDKLEDSTIYNKIINQ